MKPYFVRVSLLDRVAYTNVEAECPQGAAGIAVFKIFAGHGLTPEEAAVAIVKPANAEGVFPVIINNGAEGSARVFKGR